MSFSFESIGGFSQAVSQVIIHNSENEFDHRNYANASGDGDSTNSPENHLGPEEANDHHHDDSGPSKHNWRYNMEQNMDASLAGSNATSTAASTKARIARLKKNNNNILALEERLEMQKERYGEIHLDVAATLSVLAGQLRKRGDYAQAIDHLMKALSIRSNIFGEDHVEVAETLQDIGKCKCEVGDFGSALEYFEPALMVRNINVDSNNKSSELLLAHLYSDMGYAYWKLENTDGALEYYNLALELQEKLNVLTERASTLCSIGDIYFELMSYEKAESKYQKSLATRLEVQGKNHVDVAEVHHKLGVVYWKVGDTSAAMESFAEALRVKKMRLGAHHVSVADTLTCIGEAKFEADDTENALINFEDALKIRIEKIKDVHEEFSVLVELTNSTVNDAVKASMNELSTSLGHGAKLHYFLGKLHEKREDFVRSHSSYSKSLQMRILQNGPDHVTSIEMKQKVASMCLRLGKFEEAVKSFSNLLEAAKDEEGSEANIKVADALLNLGRAYQAYGDQNKAIDFFQEGVEMKEELFGEDHEEVVKAKEEMEVSLFNVLVTSGHEYKSKGDQYQAIKAYEQAVEMVDKQPDKHDNLVISSLFDSLADLYCNSDLSHHKIDDAVNLYKRSFGLVQQRYGPDSLEAAKSSTVLGQTLLKAGKYVEAHSTLKLSLNKIQLLNGKQHAAYAEVKHYIGETLIGTHDYHNAMRELIEAVRIREVLFSSSHPCYLDSVELIGKVHHKLGSYETALDAFDDCLKERLDLLQKKRTEFATVYVNTDEDEEGYNAAQDELLVYIGAVASVHHAIGLVKKDMNDLDGAFDSFHSELELLKRQLTEGDLKLAMANEMIGILYFDQGESDKAMNLLLSSLKVKQIKLGRRHVEYANTLINIGNIHRTKGYIDEALRVYEEAGKIKKEKAGTHLIGLYKIYETIGDIYMEKSNNEKATKSYMTSMELLVEQSGSDSPMSRILLEKLGDAHARVGEHDKALEIYKDALSRIQYDTGENEVSTDLLNKVADMHNARGEHSETVKVYANLGKNFFDNEDLEDASTFFLKALKVENVDRSSEVHIQISKSLEKIGTVLRSKGELDLALKVILESSKVLRESSSADKRDLSISLEIAGDIYLEQEDFASAQKYFEEAFSLRAQEIGAETVDCVLLNEKIASVFASQGEEEKALGAYTEVLRVKRIKMSKSASMAETIFTLGTLHRKNGDTEMAMSLFQEALTIKFKSNGADHISVAPIRAAIGDECVEMEPPDYIQACESYSEALRIWNKYGEATVGIANVHFALGKAQSNLGQFTAAASSFQSCLDIYREAKDDSSKDKIPPALSALAKAKAEVGNVDKSLACFEECLSYYKAEVTSSADEFKRYNNGENLHKYIAEYDASVEQVSHALGNVADTHYQIGLLHQKKGTKEGYKNALTSFEEVCRIRRLQRGNYHVDVATSIEAIGIILLKLGDFSEATSSFMDALQIRKSAGDSVDYAKTLTYIGQMFFMNGDYDTALQNFQEALRLRLEKNDYVQNDEAGSVSCSVSDLIDLETGRLKVVQALAYQHRSNRSQRDIACNFSDIGEVYLAKKEHGQSLNYFQSALETMQKSSMINNSDLRNVHTKIAHIYHSTNDVEKAKVSFAIALDLSKNQAGDFDSSEDTANLCETVAKFYFETRLFDDSLKYSEIAMGIRKSSLEETDPALSRIVHFLGKCYYKKRDGKKAKEYYESSLEMRNAATKEAYNAYKVAEEDSEEKAEIGELLKIRLGEAAESQHDLGLLHRDMKDYEDAIGYFRGELGFKKLQFNDRHVEYAIVLETIGTTQYMMGEINEARNSFVKALEIKRESMGEDSVEYATSLNNIGNVDFSLNEYDDALSSYLRALKIRQEKLGSDDPSVGQIQSNIGSIHYVKQEYAYAVTAYEEALRVRRIRQGNSADTAKSLCALGDAYIKNGDLELALDAYYDSFQMYKDDPKRGERSLEAAGALEGLANVCLEKNDLETAMQNFLASYEIKEELLDEEHPSVAKLLEDMGRIHSLKGEIDEAISVFQEVLRLKRLRLGEDSIEVATTWENLSNTLAKGGLHARAIKGYELAIDIKSTKFGEESMEVGILEETVGDMYVELQDYDKALEFFYKALLKQRLALGQDHVDLADLTLKLGQTHEKKGDEGKASTMFQIVKRLKGEDVDDGF